MSWLMEAMLPGCRLTFKQIVNMCNVSVNTLHFYLKKYVVYKWCMNILNEDLDPLIQAFKNKKPDAGLSYVIGFLCSTVCEFRRSGCDFRCNVLMVWVKFCNIIDHQEYVVPRSNYLWNLDGHHKLHVIVDGYCRTVSPFSFSYIFCIYIKKSAGRLLDSKQVQTTKLAQCWMYFWTQWLSIGSGLVMVIPSMSF